MNELNEIELEKARDEFTEEFIIWFLDAQITISEILKYMIKGSDNFIVFWEGYNRAQLFRIIDFVKFAKKEFDINE